MDPIKAQVDYIFNAFDRDNNDYVTFDEFSLYLRTVPYNKTDSYTQFNDADSNKDGRISREELYRLLAQTQAYQPKTKIVINPDRDVVLDRAENRDNSTPQQLKTSTAQQLNTTYNNTNTTYTPSVQKYALSNETYTPSIRTNTLSAQGYSLSNQASTPYTQTHTPIQPSDHSSDAEIHPAFLPTESPAESARSSSAAFKFSVLQKPLYKYIAEDIAMGLSPVGGSRWQKINFLADEMFGLLDKNRDGFLCLSELRQLLAKIQRRDNKSQWQIFTEFDTNNDGRISKDEFKALLVLDRGFD